MELRPLGVTSLAVDRQLLEQPYREERPITGRVQTRIRRSNAALAPPTAQLHAPRLPSGRDEHKHPGQRALVPMRDHVRTRHPLRLALRAIHLPHTACGGGKQRSVATKGNCLHQSKTGGGGSHALACETEGAAHHLPTATLAIDCRLPTADCQREAPTAPALRRSDRPRRRPASAIRPGRAGPCGPARCNPASAVPAR